MHKYTVTNVRDLTDTTLLLSLEKLSKKPFSYHPGQYGAISFNVNGHQSPARCFSIASSPTDSDILEFSIRKKGHYTNTLPKLKAGNIVKVRGPFGGFVYDENRDRESVMIAGGIGIAPFMSMIKYASSMNLGNKISLVYSNKSQDDIAFLDELVTLQKSNPNLDITFVISEGEINKIKQLQPKTGRINGDIMDELVDGDYTNKSFFICGPPPFMSAMVKLLKSKSTPNNSIMTEAFGQSSLRQTGKINSWPNNVYALGAVGLALASLTVMIKDILDTIPMDSFATPSSLTDNSSLPTNDRQAALDKLVNDLPDSKNSSPVSPKSQKAISASTSQNNSTSSSTSTNSNTSSTTSSTTSNTTTSTSNTNTTTTPKCTTSQSGITTCI